MGSEDQYKTDEPAEGLWFEQTTYAGNNLGAIAYGMHIIVWCMALHHIYKKRKRHNPWFHGLFVTVLFLMGSICIVMELYYGQKAWIDLRNYPDGPLGYMLNAEAQPINTAGAVASTITVLVGDALLIWRCYIIWGSRWYVVVIPILQWIVVCVLGFLVAKAESVPSSSLYSSITQKVGLPYFSLEMALNILCTVLIIVPLLLARRSITAAIGKEHGRMYTSVTAMMVESALPNAVFSLIFIVLYAKQNTATNLIITPLLQIQCIAPELIVLRVVRGRAWDRSTNDKLTHARQTGVYELGSPGAGTPDSGSRTKNTSAGMVFRSVDSDGGYKSTHIPDTQTKEMAHDAV